jgi:hypothetical protein
MTPHETTTSSYFLHYPRLVTDHSVEVLNGTLRTLDFETFKKLDDDWARQSYFEQTQPVFWIRTGDDDARVTAPESGPEIEEDPFAATRDDAMLIYNALLAVTGQLYPDPRLSMEYFLHGEGAWRRRVGPFERTWLLNGGGLDPTAEEDLHSIAALAEDWHKHGFRHDDLVFSPLRGLASLASTFMDAALGMLPLIVSLEGFLLPAKVDGIARHMAAVIKHLLADTAPVDLDEFMRAVYRARSSVVHGEQIPGEEISEICYRLQQLTGAVVIAAAGEMMKRQLDSQKFDTLRKEWIPK